MHCNSRIRDFPSPVGMPLTKRSLAWNNVPNPSPWTVWSKIIQESCNIFYSVGCFSIAVLMHKFGLFIARICNLYNILFFFDKRSILIRLGESGEKYKHIQWTLNSVLVKEEMHKYMFKPMWRNHTFYGIWFCIRSPNSSKFYYFVQRAELNIRTVVLLYS